MEKITYRIHWLAFTVHADNRDAFVLHDVIFRDRFGDLFPKGNGGRGFKEIYNAVLALKYYFNPINESMQYFHVEIPGEACDAIPVDHFIALKEYLDGNFPGKFKVTRFDFAFDHVGFTPQQSHDAVHDGKVRSLAKRKTNIILLSLDDVKEDGTLGTSTHNFGSRNSERMIRVYDKRGFTRLEFETKDDRAQLIVEDILAINDPDKWGNIAIAHIRDFVDFHTDWWKSFIAEVPRANRKVSDPREVSLEKLRHYIGYQTSPSLSTFIDTHTAEEFQDVVKEGRKRRGKKYNVLLNNYSGKRGEANARTS